MARPWQFSAAGGSSWDSGLYAYDPTGNILSIGSHEYRYDLFGRVAKATVAGQEQNFAYDRSGNLRLVTGAHPRTLAVNGVTIRLSAASYDERGNLVGHSLAGSEQVYGYDAFNMQQAALGPRTVADTGGW